MQEKIDQLKTLIGEVIDLQQTLGVLGWDQQTYMPPAAAADRADQQSTIARIAHIKLTSDEMGSLIHDLASYIGQLDPDSDEARMVKVAKRHYEKQTRVPTEWVAAFTQVTSLAHEAWVKAKVSSDFSIFQPHLEKIVEMRREYAGFFQPYEHVYDPLLDDYEPGMKTKDVKTIFTALRPQQVSLIEAIRSKPQVDDSFLKLEYPEDKQLAFGKEVITRLGFDWNRGWQDISVHPFTTGLGMDDVRITTRIQPDHLATALFGSVHECGHALYEMGFQAKDRRSILGTAASLAIHESQSRMYENLVGRSKSFWKYFYPRLQAFFPAQLGNVSLETFYRGINRVSPSLIRVEADEATYNLHIMLRLELELAMMEGTLRVADLPGAWNEIMKNYLGLTPENDAVGVLQDIHWSAGYFGYFSTYALGNLISAQLWECILKDIPNLPSQIEEGEFTALLSWLREKIHNPGSRYEPQELVQRVTGRKIDPQPYIRYLNQKYADIYGL